MDLIQEIRSFVPIDIDKLSQDNLSEKVVESVKTYNKAIENLRTGSEDIAMIELKKVVSTNPDFYEAVNLLGLCYAYTNQLDKAEELFGRVVQNENDVIKAADYLKYIGRGETTLKGGAPKPKSSKAAQKTKQISPAGKTGSSGREIPAETLLLNKLFMQMKKPSVSVMLNIISVVFLVAGILFFAFASKEPDVQNTHSEPASNTQQNQTQDDQLKNENKALMDQLAEANKKLAQFQLTSDLSQVSVLYGQKKYVEAADKLLTIPADNLNSEGKKLYDSLKENVFVKAASQLTYEGNSLYNGKKYNEAIQKLEKVFTMGDHWTFGDRALYILGKSYVEVNDLQKGAAAYQKLIDQYPSSAYVKYAQSRLKAIQ